MIEIRNRWTGSVMHAVDAPTTRAAVLSLIAQATEKDERANLSDADLSGANLSRADLSRADLSRANLSDADLSDADLSGADLSDADLSRANLSDADLSRANLSDADLSRADLSRADLSRANLSIPVVSDLDLRIEEVTRPNGALDMARWHTCETTHCRAGWAIQLAGAEGAALEARVGPSAAGALIYAASGSHPVPSFSADDFDARADIVARADARRGAKAED